MRAGNGCDQAQLPDTALQFPDPALADSVIRSFGALSREDRRHLQERRVKAMLMRRRRRSHTARAKSPDDTSAQPDEGPTKGGMGDIPSLRGAPQRRRSTLRRRPAHCQIFPAPRPGALRHIGEAAYEGGVNTPDASGRFAPGGLELGRYLVNPLLEIGGGFVRGGLPVPQRGGWRRSAAYPRCRCPPSGIPDRR